MIWPGFDARANFWASGPFHRIAVHAKEIGGSAIFMLTVAPGK
jgi:hypothetical protein